MGRQGEGDLSQAIYLYLRAVRSGEGPLQQVGRLVSPMAFDLIFGIEQSLLRLKASDRYLCLHFAIVFVRNQERSLQFYIETLGFRVAIDHTFKDGRRWIEVAPPDGTAHIGPTPIEPGTDSDSLTSQEAHLWFITEDVNRKYDEWTARGVHFRFPPQVPAWGGIHTRFEDPDGNCFGLAGFAELTHGVEAKRRALIEKDEAERRAAHEIDRTNRRRTPERLAVIVKEA